jgi:hypothetical protein
VSVEWALLLRGHFGKAATRHVLPCPDERVARLRLATWRGWRGRDVYSKVLRRTGGQAWEEVR